MPAKSIVTRLKHVTNARRATRKCQISLSHKPGTVETVRFPRKMLLEQGWTCEKNATFMEDASHSPLTNATVSLSNMPGTTSGTAVQIVSWARLVNPEVKASDVFLFGLHPNIKPETFLVGSEAYKLEVKASHMLLRGLHPT